jgi:hypothetical protein
MNAWIRNYTFLLRKNDINKPDNCCTGLRAQLKILTENSPITLVINSTAAPTQKLSKFIKSNIENLIKLPRNFIAVNSVKINERLVKLQVNENDRIITPKIQDFYVNFPTKWTFILEGFSNYNSSHILNLLIFKLISKCLRSCLLIYSILLLLLFPGKETWTSTKHI